MVLKLEHGCIITVGLHLSGVILYVSDSCWVLKTIRMYSHKWDSKSRTNHQYYI